MRMTSKMILKDFFPIFLGALSFFILILELIDLFANLWRYINTDTSLLAVLEIVILYIPKCVSNAFPIAILFSVAYILGNYYANNELIALFGSGVSIFQFTRPIFIIAICLSLFSFVFEDMVVAPTLKIKNKVSGQALGQTISYDNAQVTVIWKGGRFVYNVGYYNDVEKRCAPITIIERDSRSMFKRRIEALSALWDNEKNLWVLTDCRIFLWDEKGEWMIQEVYKTYEDPNFDIVPDSFKRVEGEVNDLRIKEAWEFITKLKRSGLPTNEYLTDFYKRFSFSLTPLIVALIACSMGGIFKKNILLMSLLFSILLAAGYYIAQMITSLMAKWGYISPLMGAWMGFFVFLIIGIMFYRRAKT